MEAIIASPEDLESEIDLGVRGDAKQGTGPSIPVARVSVPAGQPRRTPVGTETRATGRNRHARARRPALRRSKFGPSAAQRLPLPDRDFMSSGGVGHAMIAQERVQLRLRHS